VGQTWRARSEDGLAVTIKELPWRVWDDSARNDREARVLQQLDHPGIPSYIEHFITPQGRGRVLCIVTHFIPGITLSEELKVHRYSQLEVLDVMEELLDALCYLHDRSPPVIHRDIKPDNVVRRTDGHLVLIDFGSVQDVLADPELGNTTLTGTFGYMAPEQLQGRSTPRTDLYALGALALALLSRRPPHTLLDHRQRIDLEGAVSLHPRVALLLNRLLDPDPEQRFSSARTTRSALRAIRSMLVEPPESIPPAESIPDLEATLRRILREELSEELARRDTDESPIEDPIMPPESLPAEVPPEQRPVQLGVPHLSQRRGWWTPQPLSPKQRAAPPHPAPIIVVMAGFIGLLSLLIQLVLT